MGIFNSYVKLPEGTKHLEQWHDQTPHISPPWHGSFPSRVNPYQTILPLVAAWNLHFPRKNFWHLLATLTRVPSLFQPVWTTSPDQQYGDTSKSMIPYIWIISSYIYTCYQLQFLHHIFLGESTPHPALEPGWKGREICAPNEAEKSGAGPDWNLIPGDSTDIPVRYIFPVIEIR